FHHGPGPSADEPRRPPATGACVGAAEAGRGSHRRLQRVPGPGSTGPQKPSRGAAAPGEQFRSSSGSGPQAGRPAGTGEGGGPAPPALNLAPSLRTESQTQTRRASEGTSLAGASGLCPFSPRRLSHLIFPGDKLLGRAIPV